jgi:hypothetical protein
MNRHSERFLQPAQSGAKGSNLLTCEEIASGIRPERRVKVGEDRPITRASGSRNDIFSFCVGYDSASNFSDVLLTLLQEAVL